ncbi:MAG: SDR family NAD(P)-dependent oxidoreductase, partial [Thermoleophilaceae bacterium]
MAPTTDIAGLTVAVTGGANGIGRAVAERFARAGARVTIGDVDGPAAEAAAAAIGAGAAGVAVDVSDREAFEAFLAEAERRHGPLDVLVNNAGIDWIGPFHEEPDEVSRRQIEVNLGGAVNGSRLALRRMLPRGRGHLVNVASGVGRVPLPGSAVYSATKHGVVGLTESLRLEYRGSGVRFSVIQPAQVDTAMLDGQGRPKALPLVTADDVA